MEKKTMGSFIAALRKANGLTQKDLAEKLNVSDKAVSRWERDENAPDLSLIPVIADIFGITADELLRGERRKPADTAGTVINAESLGKNTEENGFSEKGTTGEAYSFSAKSEKQIKHLINKVEYDFKIKNYIDYMIVLVAVIAAGICNFVVRKCLLGFVLGAGVLAIAVICEFIFYSISNRSLVSEELPDEMIGKAKNKIYIKFKHTLLIDIMWLVAMIPLCFVWEDWSLMLITWIVYGGVDALIVFALYCMLSPCIDIWAVHRGINYLSETEQSCTRSKIESRKNLCKKAGKLAIADVIVVVLAVVWATHQFSIYDDIACRAFESVESFVRYIEGAEDEDVEEITYNGDAGGIIYSEVTVKDSLDDKQMAVEKRLKEIEKPYLNEEGVYVTKEIEEMLKEDENILDDVYEECVDENGNVVFAFYNMIGVPEISYGKFPGGKEYENKNGEKYLPIYTITNNVLRYGKMHYELRIKKIAIYTTIFLVLGEIIINMVVMGVRKIKNKQRNKL